VLIVAVGEQLFLRHFCVPGLRAGFRLAGAGVRCVPAAPSQGADQQECLQQVSVSTSS